MVRPFMKLRYSKEVIVIAKWAARGLALSALLLAGSSLAFAQAHDMSGMPGMSGPKIVVTPGAATALFCVATSLLDRGDRDLVFRMQTVGHGGVEHAVFARRRRVLRQ